MRTTLVVPGTLFVLTALFVGYDHILAASVGVVSGFAGLGRILVSGTRDYDKPALGVVFVYRQ